MGGIADVVQEVWNREILRYVCEAHLEDDDCSIWVAAQEDRVLGFVSAFLTVGSKGCRRWEVDLVAVRPAHQGQGLGHVLIKQVFEDGRGHDADIARALIRIANLPSQRAFTGSGFRTDNHVHRLLLWAPEIGDDVTSCPNGVWLRPVDTLMYRGLWIEGLTSVPAEAQRRAVRAARAIVAEESRANVGAVIVADEENRLAPDLRDQMHVHGDYCWFVRRK